MFSRAINNRAALISECDKVHVYIYIQNQFSPQKQQNTIRCSTQHWLCCIEWTEMKAEPAQSHYTCLQRESTSGFDCFSRCLTLAIIGEFGKHVKVFPKSVFRANKAYRSLMSELYESFHFKHDSISNAKKISIQIWQLFIWHLGKSSTYNVL